MDPTAKLNFEGDYGAVISCLFFEEEQSLLCNGTSYVIPEKHLNYHDTLFWVFISLYIFLMLMSGIFSGLVLGVVALDLTSLKVSKNAGLPDVKKYADKIAPLVENHHLLLVTLLLANAIAMEALPLCLDRVSDPVTAMIVSVSTVLFFGEVIPQAICARYGLAIGYYLRPLVYFLIGLFFIVSYPIAKLLDCILGREHGTYYRRAELKALVDLHGTPQSDNTENSRHQDILTRDEIMIIQGALDMQAKTAASAMIPLPAVFMLTVDTCFNDEVLSQIQKTGYSRIPIYDHCRGNIVGILMVKSLIKLDPKEAKPIRQLFGTRAVLKPHFVSEDMSLFDILNHFQTGKNHISVVVQGEKSELYCTTIPRRESLITIKEECDCTYNEVLGVITLERIIEDLLQKKINKESDFQSSLNSVLNYALSKLSLRQVPSSSNLSHMQSVAEERDLRSPSFTISFHDSSASYSKL
ncbi:hypothetical protein CHUAL_011424 [Chamberlinius hualienensis]